MSSLIVRLGGQVIFMFALIFDSWCYGIIRNNTYVIRPVLSAHHATEKLTLSPFMTGEITVGGQRVQVLFDTQAPSTSPSLNLWMFAEDIRESNKAPLNYYSPKSSHTKNQVTNPATGDSNWSKSTPKDSVLVNGNPSGVTISGSLISDTVEIGTLNFLDTNMVIVNNWKGPKPDQFSNFAGVLGLGCFFDDKKSTIISTSGDISLPSKEQLFIDGLPNKMFSVYMPPGGASSEIFLGGLDTGLITPGSELELFNVHRNVHCGYHGPSWCVGTYSVTLLPVVPGADKKQKKKQKQGRIQNQQGEKQILSTGGAIFATASPFIYLPQQAFQEFKAALAPYHAKPGEGGEGHMPVLCSSLSSLPELGIYFGSRTPHSLTGREYTASPASEQDTYCQLLVAPHNKPYLIIGQPFMRKYYTVYYRRQKMASIAPETLHFGTKKFPGKFKVARDNLYQQAFLVPRKMYGYIVNSVALNPDPMSSELPQIACNYREEDPSTLQEIKFSIRGDLYAFGAKDYISTHSSKKGKQTDGEMCSLLIQPTDENHIVIGYQALRNYKGNKRGVVEKLPGSSPQVGIAKAKLGGGTNEEKKKKTDKKKKKKKGSWWSRGKKMFGRRRGGGNTADEGPNPSAVSSVL